MLVTPEKTLAQARVINLADTQHQIKTFLDDIGLEATDIKPGSDFFAAPQCTMELANRFFADELEWDSANSRFKRLSLERCMELAGIQREGKAHRALSDVLATVDLLQYMARQS